MKRRLRLPHACEKQKSASTRNPPLFTSSSARTPWRSRRLQHTPVSQTHMVARPPAASKSRWSGEFDFFFGSTSPPAAVAVGPPSPAINEAWNMNYKLLHRSHRAATLGARLWGRPSSRKRQRITLRMLLGSSYSVVVGAYIFTSIFSFFITTAVLFIRQATHLTHLLHLPLPHKPQPRR